MKTDRKVLLATLIFISIFFVSNLGRVQAGNEVKAGPEFIVTADSGSQEYPSVAINNSEKMVVVWTDSDYTTNPHKCTTIYMQIFDADRNPIGLDGNPGGRIKVNQPINSQPSQSCTEENLRPEVAMNDSGEIVVVWQYTSYEQNGANGIYVKKYSATNSLGQTWVNKNGSQSAQYPSVAIDSNGRFVVAWQLYSNDIMFKRFQANGGATEAAPVPIRTAGDLYGMEMPMVRLNSSGDIIIAYSAYELFYSPKRIVIKKFDFVSDTPLATAVIDNDKYFESSQVSLGLRGKDFVLAWASDPTGGGSTGEHKDILVKKFRIKNDNTFLESPTIVNIDINNGTYDHNYYPAVAIDSEGNFIVTWLFTNFYVGPPYTGWLYAKAFKGNVSDVTFIEENNFQVETPMYVMSNGNSIRAWPKRPAIAINGYNDFVVVWERQMSDPCSVGWCSHSNIYGQKYSRMSTDIPPVVLFLDML